MKQSRVLSAVVVYLLAISLTASVTAARQAEQEAKDILEATGVKGGFIVHIGCGDGHLYCSRLRNPLFSIRSLLMSDKQYI